jgi:hypothetical protein
MIEVGCNVVVLSLENYEELKKADRQREKLEKAIAAAFRFKKPWWEGYAPELNIDLKVFEPQIKAAWDMFDEKVKEQYHLNTVDADTEHYWHGASIGLIEKNPDPEPTVEALEEENKDVQQ